MKTVTAKLIFTVPENSDAAKVQEIVTLDLKRAMRIFGMVKGVNVEVAEPPKKTKRSRR